jgi:hypothetical protein
MKDIKIQHHSLSHGKPCSIHNFSCIYCLTHKHKSSIGKNVKGGYKILTINRSKQLYVHPLPIILKIEQDIDYILKVKEIEKLVKILLDKEEERLALSLNCKNVHIFKWVGAIDSYQKIYSNVPNKTKLIAQRERCIIGREDFKHSSKNKNENKIKEISIPIDGSQSSFLKESIPTDGPYSSFP